MQGQVENQFTWAQGGKVRGNGKADLRGNSTENEGHREVRSKVSVRSDLGTRSL